MSCARAAGRPRTAVEATRSSTSIRVLQLDLAAGRRPMQFRDPPASCMLCCVLLFSLRLCVTFFLKCSVIHSGALLSRSIRIVERLSKTNYYTIDSATSYIVVLELRTGARAARVCLCHA